MSLAKFKFMINIHFKFAVNDDSISIWHKWEYLIQWTDIDRYINLHIKNIHTYLVQTPEIGQGLGRFLSCVARKQEQT